MNLQTLSSIDISSLRRTDLTKMARAIRNEYKYIDLRSTDVSLIEYIEEYKRTLANSATATVDENETDEEIETPVDNAIAVGSESAEIKRVVFVKKSENVYSIDGAVCAIIAADFFPKAELVAATASPAPNDSETLWLDYPHPHGITPLGATSLVGIPGMKSRSRLVWERHSPKPIPPLIEYVEDIETRLFCLPFSELIQLALSDYFSEKDIKSVAASMSPLWNMSRKNLVSHLKEVGARVRTAIRPWIGQIASTAKVMPIHGRRAVAVEISSEDAHLVDRLSKHILSQRWFTQHDMKFVAVYYHDSGKAYVSLRSNFYNCLPVARAYRGHGEPQSCEFALPGDFGDHFPDRPTAY